MIRLKNIRQCWNIQFITIFFLNFYFWIYRFLQGPETDPATVRKIREAIDNQTDVTVQLINYTKSGMLAFAISESWLALSA